MTENRSPDTRLQGVLISNADIYKTVLSLKDEITKLKTVYGLIMPIITTALGAVSAYTLTKG